MLPKFDFSNLAVLSQYFKFSFIYLKAGQIPLLRSPSVLWCCELVNKSPIKKKRKGDKGLLCFSSPDAQSEADPKGHNVLFLTSAVKGSKDFMLNIIIWDPMGQEVFMYVYRNEKITSQGACIVNEDG